MLWMWATAALAAVTTAGPGGFLVTHEVVVERTPVEAWSALVDVGSWWHEDHTWSGNAANLTLDPRPGGCFCEAMPNDGGVRHMAVEHVAPGELLRMTGGLGPLQALPVQGVLTWTLAPEGEGTRVTMTYTVGGWAPGGGLDQWASPVDQVLGLQIVRYAEAVVRATGESGGTPGP